jgi:type III secretion protein C
MMKYGVNRPASIVLSMVAILMALDLAAASPSPPPMPAASSAPSAPASMPTSSRLPWPDAPFAYFAKGETVAKVIGEFAKTFGLETRIAASVTGAVNGRFTAGNPRQFLDGLGATYGFVWYHHGGVLYISRSNEVVTRTYRMSAGEVSQFRAALTTLGVFDERFGWAEFADRGVVMVSGPPVYLELISKTLEQLGPSSSAPHELRIFTLKYANVEDRSYTYRDRQITQPGVATILRNLIEGGGDTRGMTLVAPRLGQDAKTSSTGRAETTAGDKGDGGRAPAGGGSASTARASIQGDARLNAVIVRDSPDRMAMYERLIRELDIPSALIEIEASIIDVNTTRTHELGINWAMRRNDRTFGFGNVNQEPDSATLLGARGPESLNRTTILANTANFFLSQVRILEGLGDARVLAKPSVLTVDNLGAVLDLSETFYIRVQGERVADVIPVTTGTLLKVTPRLINAADGKRLVQLVVDVEDGSVQDRQFDRIPTVRKSTINTQAVIGENESLLIGGYFLDQDIANNDRVPVIGQAPVLGWFFRNQAATKQKRERLFMITPRVIGGEGATR